MELQTSDRILILAPHPDDEILGCGGVIMKAFKMGLPIQIVFLTYGDSNEWSFMKHRKYPVIIPQQVRQMGLIRYKEAMEATKLLGVPSNQVIFLGYPDFGTLRIWQSRWKHRPPLRSLFTKVRKVPYENAFRPGAPYKGEEILDDLRTIIKQFRPTKIFLSHWNDFNTDHQALYLFTRVVLWDLEKEISPKIYPFLIHFDKWPYPRVYQPLDPLEPPKSLENSIKWEKLELNLEEIRSKYYALDAHKTQINSNQKYLHSFIKTNELFGDYSIISTKEIDSPTSIEKGVISTVLPSEELEEGPEFLAIEDESIHFHNDHFTVSVRLSGLISKRKRDKPKGWVTKKIERFLPVTKEGTILSETKEGPIPASVPSIFPKNIVVAFHIFGYRYDRPFRDMPKFWIRVGRKRYTFFDLDKQMSQIIKVTRQGSEIKVSLPLKMLKSPDFILVNVRNYMSIYTIDWVPWRIIKIEK